MKRRNFLKGILGVGAVAAVPALANTEKKKTFQQRVDDFKLKCDKAIEKIKYTAIKQDEIDLESPISLWWNNDTKKIEISTIGQGLNSGDLITIEGYNEVLRVK